ncbi:MAG: inositol monophosphatase family protein [Cyclonatronaceae bacterium]
MTEKEYDVRFRWLYPHLEEAGRILRLQQHNRRFQVSIKRDGSKVTDTDRNMSDFWLELLQKAFPGETVVSEEEKSSHIYPEKSSVVWYIDPIDGTSKFIEGSPNYFVLIGLCLDGKPSFGVLYQPERNCVLYGNSRIRSRLYTAPENYREIHQTISWRHQMPLVVKGASPVLRDRMESITHLPVRRTSNAAHNIIGPLNGPSTGFVSFRRTAYWDVSAPAAIMESAGFQTRILRHGEDVRYNDGNVFCDRFFCLPPDTPDEVIEYVTGVTA